MLNNIFDTEDIPNYKIYETAQKVINDYMNRNNCKISQVASELETTTGVLYRQLNAKDTAMPLNIDRLIAISRLCDDDRIIRAIAKEFDLRCVGECDVVASNSNISSLVDNVSIESADVFRVVKKALEDDNITEKEKEDILKEIDEAEQVLLELKSEAKKIESRKI